MVVGSGWRRGFLGMLYSLLATNYCFSLTTSHWILKISTQKFKTGYNLRALITDEGSLPTECGSEYRKATARQ